MSLRKRAGFTLPDLLTGILLLAVVGAALSRTLLAQRRTILALTDRTAARRSLDQAALWLQSELGQSGRWDSVTDLLVVAPESLTYRATRGIGVACLVQPDVVEFRLRDFSAWRRPQPGRDSLLVYLGADSGGHSRWLPGPITGVSASTCAGFPSLHLATALDSGLLVRYPGPNRPVRVEETMQLRFYRAQNAWWLGARSVSAGEGLQPVAGPFTPAGFRLDYRDTLDRPTLDPADIRLLEVRLVAGADSTRLLLWPRNLQ